MPKTLPVAPGRMLACLIRCIAAICLIAVVAAASPSAVRAETAKTTKIAHPSSKAAKAKAGAKPTQPRPGIVKLEKRISALRDQLGITAAQRNAWRKLALVMRENETAMYTVVTRRAGRIQSVNGPENLRLYGLIAAVHAANVQRLLGALQPLYDSFSQPQKKIADKLLRSSSEAAFSDGY